jgi:hypothetical protein
MGILKLFGVNTDVKDIEQATQLVVETAIASAAGNMDLVTKSILTDVTTTIRGLLAEQNGWNIVIHIPDIKIPDITISLHKPK